MDALRDTRWMPKAVGDWIIGVVTAISEVPSGLAAVTSPYIRVYLKTTEGSQYICVTTVGLKDWYRETKPVVGQEVVCRVFGQYAGPHGPMQYSSVSPLCMSQGRERKIWETATQVAVSQIKGKDKIKGKVKFFKTETPGSTAHFPTKNQKQGHNAD